MKRTVLALVLLGCLLSAPVVAQYLGTSSISGGGGGAMSADAIMDAMLTVDGAGSQLDADFLDAISSQGFCQVTGGAACTMTGSIVSSGVATDVTTATNEDYVVASAGTGDIELSPGGSDIRLFGSDNGNINYTSSRIRIQGAGASAGGVLIGVAGDGVVIGSRGARSASEPCGRISDSIDGSNVDYMSVFCEGMMILSPQTALTVSSPTDTTTTPTTSSSHCRMSSSGAAAWTPAETGAVNGAFFCCTNTAANAITMTESAGVYEGPATASVVGQWDTVCMEYVTDRWVQRSFSDN